jgi:hypothetical protein
LEFVNIIAVSSRYFLQRYQPIAVKFGGRAFRPVFSRSVTVAPAAPLAFDTLEFANLGDLTFVQFTMVLGFAGVGFIAYRSTRTGSALAAAGSPQGAVLS